jgi:pantoate--beta-alanine ligase
MGALHQGHLSLIRSSKMANTQTFVSIFVNPTQFAPHEDLEKYPRPFDKDCELAEEAGADYIFAPSVEEIYPSNPTKITVPGVTTLFEGERRPGHFEGVATIVNKLFNIVQPDIAYFGRKDLQQCAVILKMVRDLNIDTRISIQETIRDVDGLALSSRNQYLSADQRITAPKIYEELQRTRNILCQSSVSLENLQHSLDESKTRLTSHGFDVEYFELVNIESFLPTTEISDNSYLITAAKLGITRLIDNIKILW